MHAEGRDRDRRTRTRTRPEGVSASSSSCDIALGTLLHCYLFVSLRCFGVNCQQALQYTVLCSSAIPGYGAGVRCATVAFHSKREGPHHHWEP